MKGTNPIVEKDVTIIYVTLPLVFEKGNILYNVNLCKLVLRPEEGNCMNIVFDLERSVSYVAPGFEKGNSLPTVNLCKSVLRSEKGNCMNVVSDLERNVSRPGYNILMSMPNVEMIYC
jgi:hypothetical protein